VLQAFAGRGGRVVPGAGGGRLALLARSRRLAREAAGVVAFLYPSGEAPPASIPPTGRRCLGRPPR